MKVALQNTALFAFLVISLAYVGPRIDEAQAQEDAATEAQQQAQQELIKQQALQDQCGGPEATVVEKARGGYDCFDTNGRKTKTIQGAKS